MRIPQYTASRLMLVLVLMVGMALVAGCGGGGGDEAAPPIAAGASSEDDSTEGPGGAPSGPGIQMSAGMPGMGGMGGMGMGGPMGAPGMGGGSGAEAPQSVAAGPQVTTKPPNARPDPFAPWWDSTPPPPPAVTLVEPYRIATRDTYVRPPEEKVEIQEVPNRRVSGVATGLGVYALIEGPEGQTVVRPGDSVGDYRVEAIRARSVLLQRKVGNVTYTQEVPLTDVGSQQRTNLMGGMRGAPGGAGMMFRGGASGAPPLMGGMGGGMGGPLGAESEQ